MAKFVSHNAMLRCSFGTAPSVYQVAPNNRIIGPNGPLASIMDHKPFANIKPFGMCTSVSNPAVAAATAAALGVLTPQPCVPATVAPWVVGASTVQTPTCSALNDTAKCMCMWAGVIQVAVPGQATVEVPA